MPARRKARGIAANWEWVARSITAFTGSNRAFACAALLILGWAATGPFFNYSDTWQLVINTGTTIITFLMVFVIQQTQNKDSLAVHLKLNEIVAALHGASNRLVDAEDLSEHDMNRLEEHYQDLAAVAREENQLLTNSAAPQSPARRTQRKPKQTNGRR